jgi:hypothetical protein
VSTHALLSPSSAHRWMACPGSVVLTRDAPDTGSKFADEGTDAHELAALCLTTGKAPVEFLGMALEKGNVVDDDMVLHVGAYVDYVREVARATCGDLMVEQKLPISNITGEPDAKGTADAVILAGDELIVIDLKYGRGVPVDAEDNPQLQIYGLAALREFDVVGDFERVRMVIHQPRLNSVSEWVQTVEELNAFDDQVSEAALNVERARSTFIAWPSAASDRTGWEGDHLFPGGSQCKFCAAKATCPALAAKVQEEIGAEFEHLGDIAAVTEMVPRLNAEALSQALSAADLIESWLKAVRAEVEAQLLAGKAVPGFKLVQGKKGNRAWTSKEEAEAVLKAMRVKHEQMYDYSVISPTSAEKLAKAEVIGPRQWPKLQSLITQAEGKPSVAPVADKRPALAVAAVADDFADETAATDLA